MSDYGQFRGIQIVLGALLDAGICATSWPYEYDENDRSQGAGAEASWRAVARWDEVDEAGTKEMFAALKERFGWTFPREMRVHLLDNEGKKFLRTGRQTWALMNGKKRSTK